MFLVIFRIRNDDADSAYKTMFKNEENDDGDEEDGRWMMTTKKWCVCVCVY